MNPIDDWDKARINEIREGGNPTHCIIGSDDYASLCGAIGLSYGFLPFGREGKFIYQGITVMQSIGTKTGIMFA